MKLTIEITTATHLHLNEPERKEFYVKSLLSGMGHDSREHPEAEACCSGSEPYAQLQAIGLARLIDLDREIHQLIDDYSASSNPRDWRILKTSSNEQSDS